MEQDKEKQAPKPQPDKKKIAVLQALKDAAKCNNTIVLKDGKSDHS